MNLTWTSRSIGKGRCRKATGRTHPPALVLEPLEARDLLSFLPAVTYRAGDNPRMVTAGDFNNDSVLDLAAAVVERTGMVSVLFGSGDGTFQPRMTFDVGYSVLALAPGDFNGDGLLDVATANPEGVGLSVLLGHGDGTFQLAGHYEVYVPYMIAARDFNGDGLPDLVLTTDHGSSVSLLVGNGDGTFQAPRRTESAGRRAPWLEVEDLNGDGLLDLALPNPMDHTVSVLLGDGDGTTFWRAGDVTILPPQRNPWGVAAGDFDSNGLFDLAVPNAGSTDDTNVRVFLGSGDGSFAGAGDYGAGNQPRAVAAGDWDGDAALDLVVANYSSNTVSLLLGNGDGTFRPADPQDYAVGVNPANLIPGDFNGDGYLDLAVLNVGSQTVSVLLNAGPGSSPFPPAGGSSPTNSDTAAAAALADWLPSPNALPAVIPVKGVSDASPLHVAPSVMPFSEKVSRQEVAPGLTLLTQAIEAWTSFALDDALMLADLTHVWAGGTHLEWGATSGFGIEPH